MSLAISNPTFCIMDIFSLATWRPILSLLVLTIGTLGGGVLVRSFHQTYGARKRIARMRSQGIPILPHSMIFGHLPIMAAYRKAHPSDVNILELQLWLAANFKTYFPELESIPPVIYLDICPILSYPLAFVYDVAMARDLTQSSGLPRSPIQKSLFTTLTMNQDLFSMEGAEWKTWRTRFNPGFSPRNTTAIIPEIIEEILIFVEGLQQMAGADGAWGSMFTLANRTSNLTLDVIFRATLDTRLHEQTTPGGTPLKRAILDTLRIGTQGSGSFLNGWRLTPEAWRRAAELARNQRTMQDFFSPSIQKITSTASENTKKKMVVKLAWDHMSGEGLEKQLISPDSAFVDVIANHLKVFVFAGYDTTATTLCWMFKMLQDNPLCLAELRAEHDKILGRDPEKAADILKESPSLLNSLLYTNAIIKETLRLHSPAASMRQGAAGYFLTSQGSDIRYPTEGFSISDGAHWVQLDPHIWPRANDFLPERWLTSKDDHLHPAPNAWRPFGIGPRNCAGQDLAMTEMKLVAALVVRKFDVEEAWADWDSTKGPDYPKHTLYGERLYATGIGPAHLKDDMPVHVRVRQG